MNQKLNNFIEHTILKPDTKAKDVERICLEAISNDFLGVCVNINYIKLAKEFLKGTNKKVISVVNFPLASNTIDIIRFQTSCALEYGADEIDSVLNISAVKNKDYKKAAQEIEKTKEICKNNPLKIIIETDLLTKEEIKDSCKILIDGGADFIKTSTGFVKNGVGAKVEDVKLIYENIKSSKLKIKASGGIKTYDDAINLINAGASRLGTSSGVEIVSKGGLND